jgi:hypothetical protein
MSDKRPQGTDGKWGWQNHDWMFKQEGEKKRHSLPSLYPSRSSLDSKISEATVSEHVIILNQW